jgi:phage shock protein E
MLGLEKLFGPKTDFKALVAAGAVIVDVREPAEFNAGHIKGSKNISMGRLQQMLPEIRKWNKTVITCCRSGARSGMSTRFLKNNGIETYNGGPWTSLEKKIL